MSKTWEALAKEAGVDLDAAKKSLAELDEAFGGEAGDIPDGALMAWTHGHFSDANLRRMAFLLGKQWEREIPVAKDREWEKGPDAAKIKAERNLKKAAKK